MSHVDEGTLHAYLDGELSPTETQGIDAHLAQCPGCRERLDVERALIARAGELLALAAPPDRELPPFRAGDLKPPTRLWWQVRLPLAWAATVVVALGIGTYLGSGAFERARPAGTAVQRVAGAESVGAPATPAIPQERAPAAVFMRQRAEARATKPSPAPAARVEKADRIALRDEVASLQSKMERTGAGLSLDSARVVLGQDPLLLPGAPIVAVRQERAPGYAAVVVIAQRLDSGTVIELAEGRAVSFNLDAVAVTAAEGVARAAPESLRREVKARDDVLAAKRAAPAPAPAPALAPAQPAPVEPAIEMVRRVDSLDVRISGPLPADSLRKLLLLVRPAKP